MRRSNRSKGKSVVNEGEPSNPPEPTPPTLDATLIRSIVQEVLAESQGRVVPERTETPSRGRPARQEQEGPVPQVVPNRVDPIQGLAN